MLNHAVMMGRLCADPELKHTHNGVAVCSTRIAVDRDYAKDGKKETDFFDVVAWRGTAEFICSYFSKGRMIAVEGRMQTRPWTDRDGNKRVAIELVPTTPISPTASGTMTTAASTRGITPVRLPAVTAALCPARLPATMPRIGTDPI